MLIQHETVLLLGKSMAAAELMFHRSQSRGIEHDMGPSSYLVVMRQNNQRWLDFLCCLLNDDGNVSCITVDSVCKEMKIPLYTRFVQFVLYPVQASVSISCGCKTICEPEASTGPASAAPQDRGPTEQMQGYCIESNTWLGLHTVPAHEKLPCRCQLC